MLQCLQIKTNCYVCELNLVYPKSIEMGYIFLTYIYLRENIVNIYKYSNILSSYSYIT